MEIRSWTPLFREDFLVLPSRSCSWKWGPFQPKRQRIIVFQPIHFQGAFFAVGCREGYLEDHPMLEWSDVVRITSILLAPKISAHLEVEQPPRNREDLRVSGMMLLHHLGFQLSNLKWWSSPISGCHQQPWAPKTMKNKGFGHLKTRLFAIKNL